MPWCRLILPALKEKIPSYEPAMSPRCDMHTRSQLQACTCILLQQANVEDCTPDEVETKQQVDFDLFWSGKHSEQVPVFSLAEEPVLRACFAAVHQVTSQGTFLNLCRISFLAYLHWITHGRFPYTFVT